MTKEGFLFPLPFVLIAAVLFIIFSRTLNVVFVYWAIGFFFFGLLVMLFFRDPERKIPDGDNLILSPADGKIILLNEKPDGKVISIFLSIFNVHVNRAPVTGIVKSVNFIEGKFHIASAPKAKDENQRNEIEFSTENGVIQMNQVTGAIARRTIFTKKPHDSVQAGERVGLIRFGSRVDLFVPQTAQINIHLGQKVTAGKTIIGKLS